MNNSNETNQHDEDVVVIEERDKRTYLYIAIAAVLGLALGGLIGSSVTAKQWEANYQVLEEKYQQVEDSKKASVDQAAQRQAALSAEVEEKISAAVAERDLVHQAEVEQLKAQITKLESSNKTLKAQVSEKAKLLTEADDKNMKLNAQADIQATVLERSREVFQREVKVKQELAALQSEREKLVPKIAKLKKECDVYLEGRSWDAKSDACDKQDEANSRLSQLDQMIKVHQMDLQQIKALTEGLGM